MRMAREGLRSFSSFHSAILAPSYLRCITMQQPPCVIFPTRIDSAEATSAWMDVISVIFHGAAKARFSTGEKHSQRVSPVVYISSKYVCKYTSLVDLLQCQMPLCRFMSQKWELAAAAFQHLEVVLELAGRCGAGPGGLGERQAPGWAVMHDLLGSGPTLQVGCGRVVWGGAWEKGEGGREVARLGR